MATKIVYPRFLLPAVINILAISFLLSLDIVK